MSSAACLHGPRLRGLGIIRLLFVFLQWIVRTLTTPAAPPAADLAAPTPPFSVSAAIGALVYR
jgi:hypothetical protein